jgi:hypothetical protein
MIDNADSVRTGESRIGQTKVLVVMNELWSMFAAVSTHFSTENYEI